MDDTSKWSRGCLIKLYSQKLWTEEQLTILIKTSHWTIKTLSIFWTTNSHFCIFLCWKMTSKVYAEPSEGHTPLVQYLYSIAAYLVTNYCTKNKRKSWILDLFTCVWHIQYMPIHFKCGVNIITSTFKSRVITVSLWHVLCESQWRYKCTLQTRFSLSPGKKFISTPVASGWVLWSIGCGSIRLHSPLWHGASFPYYALGSTISPQLHIT